MPNLYPFFPSPTAKTRTAALRPHGQGQESTRRASGVGAPASALGTERRAKQSATHAGNSAPQPTARAIVEAPGKSPPNFLAPAVQQELGWLSNMANLVTLVVIVVTMFKSRIWFGPPEQKVRNKLCRGFLDVFDSRPWPFLRCRTVIATHESAGPEVRLVRRGLVWQLGDEASAATADCKASAATGNAPRRRASPQPAVVVSQTTADNVANCATCLVKRRPVAFPRWTIQVSPELFDILNERVGVIASFHDDSALAYFVNRVFDEAGWTATCAGNGFSPYERLQTELRNGLVREGLIQPVQADAGMSRAPLPRAFDSSTRKSGAQSCRPLPTAMRHAAGALRIIDWAEQVLGRPADAQEGWRSHPQFMDLVATVAGMSRDRAENAVHWLAACTRLATASHPVVWRLDWVGGGPANAFDREGVPLAALDGAIGSDSELATEFGRMHLRAMGWFMAPESPWVDHGWAALHAAYAQPNHLAESNRLVRETAMDDELHHRFNRVVRLRHVLASRYAGKYPGYALEPAFDSEKVSDNPICRPTLAPWHLHHWAEHMVELAMGLYHRADGDYLNSGWKCIQPVLARFHPNAEMGYHANDRAYLKARAVKAILNYEDREIARPDKLVDWWSDDNLLIRNFAVPKRVSKVRERIPTQHLDRIDFCETLLQLARIGEAAWATEAELESHWSNARNILGKYAVSGKNDVSYQLDGLRLMTYKADYLRRRGKAAEASDLLEHTIGRLHPLLAAQDRELPNQDLDYAYALLSLCRLDTWAPDDQSLYESRRVDWLTERPLRISYPRCMNHLWQGGFPSDIRGIAHDAQRVGDAPPWQTRTNENWLKSTVFALFSITLAMNYVQHAVANGTEDAQKLWGDLPGQAFGLAALYFGGEPGDPDVDFMKANETLVRFHVDGSFRCWTEQCSTISSEQLVVGNAKPIQSPRQLLDAIRDPSRPSPFLLRSPIVLRHKPLGDWGQP